MTLYRPPPKPGNVFDFTARSREAAAARRHARLGRDIAAIAAELRALHDQWREARGLIECRVMILERRTEAHDAELVLLAGRVPAVTQRARS